MSLRLLGDEVDWAEDAGRNGFDVLEIAHLEAISILRDQRTIVVGRQRSPGIDGRVEDVNLDVILTRLEQPRNVEPVGRMPERACGLSVDGCLLYTSRCV